MMKWLTIALCSLAACSQSGSEIEFTLTGQFGGAAYASTVKGDTPGLGAVTGLPYYDLTFGGSSNVVDAGKLSASGGESPQVLEFPSMPFNIFWKGPVEVSMRFADGALYAGRVDLEVLNIEHTSSEENPFRVTDAKAAGTLTNSANGDTLEFVTSTMTWTNICDGKENVHFRTCGNVEGADVREGSYAIPAATQTGCAATLVEKFVSGTTATLKEPNLNIGGESPLQCSRTTTAGFCSRRDTVTVEGCTWDVLAVSSYDAFEWTVSARSEDCDTVCTTLGTGLVR